jgi:hypothetical protein
LSMFRPFLGRPSLSLPRLFLPRLFVTGFGIAWSVGGYAVANRQWGTTGRIVKVSHELINWVVPLLSQLIAWFRPPISQWWRCQSRVWGVFEGGFAGTRIGNSLFPASKPVRLAFITQQPVKFIFLKLSFVLTMNKLQCFQSIGPYYYLSRSRKPVYGWGKPINQLHLFTAPEPVRFAAANAEIWRLIKLY